MNSGRLRKHIRKMKVDFLSDRSKVAELCFKGILDVEWRKIRKKARYDFNRLGSDGVMEVQKYDELSQRIFKVGR